MLVRSKRLMRKPSDFGLWLLAAMQSWKPVPLIQATKCCLRPRCPRVCRRRPMTLNIFPGQTVVNTVGASSSQGHRAYHVATRKLSRLCLLPVRATVLSSAKLCFCRDR